MAYDIIHKNSTVSGTPPAVGEIELGEIAINAADAELYVKDTAGNIRKFQNTTNNTANRVQFIQAGSGAVQRTVESKLQDVVNVKDFGAVGDGVTDDTAAIQAAIDSLIGLGGTLYIPRGIYLVSDVNADGTCLLCRQNIQIVGDGAFFTVIRPSNGLSSSANIITFYPEPPGGAGEMFIFSSIEGVFIGDPNSISRTGNHGIYLDTTRAQANAPNFTVKDCWITDGAGAAFCHENNPASNPNGGMYASRIENNILRGGIKLIESGDSIVIRENILTGGKWGVDAKLIAGASLLSIIDNNITNSSGLIRITRGLSVSILRNNCEHYAASSETGAAIDIDPDTDYRAGAIAQNLFAVFGSSTASSILRLRSAKGTHVEDNVFLSGLAAGAVTAAIEVSSTCEDVRIGPNSFNATLESYKVSDSGVGTMGVVKPVTLLNDWVEFGAADTPSIWKDTEGVVHFSGTIKNGTTTFGTTLFDLPAGFRPSAACRFGVFCSAGGPTLGRVDVDYGGAVYIAFGANEFLTLSGISFKAARSGDSVAIG